MADLVVCGCNRTGTSSMARLLHEAGLHIHGPLVPANAGNPGGYWEPQSFKALVEFTLRHGDLDPGIFPAAFRILMNRPGRWVWKYPGAVFVLDKIREGSPKVMVVGMHREKEATLDSLIRHCLLVGAQPASREIYSSWYDQAERSFREYGGPKVRIELEDLARDPAGTVKRVLGSWGSGPSC